MKMIKWIPIYGLLWKERRSYMYDWDTRKEKVFEVYHVLWVFLFMMLVCWGILKLFQFF